jgi:hypothetical protein
VRLYLSNQAQLFRRNQSTLRSRTTHILEIGSACVPLYYRLKPARFHQSTTPIMPKRKAKDLGDEGSADRPRRSSRRVSTVANANGQEEEVIARDVGTIYILEREFQPSNCLMKYFMRLLYGSGGSPFTRRKRYFGSSMNQFVRASL